MPGKTVSQIGNRVAAALLHGRCMCAAVAAQQHESLQASDRVAIHFRGNSSQLGYLFRRGGWQQLSTGVATGRSSSPMVRSLQIC